MSRAEAIGKLVAVTAVSVAVLVALNTALSGYAPATGGVPPELYGLTGAEELRPVTEGGEVLYYEAVDSSGRLLGYGFVADFRGMWGDMRVAGGMDREFQLTGIEVLEHEETPGIGSLVEEPSFESQFEGLEPSETRLTRSGGEVDAVSGATITSRAVADGVRDAAEEVQREVESR